jgi:hypothetical protein
MTTSTTDKVDINKKIYKQPPYAYDAVQITITPDERKYLIDIAAIMSKLMVKENNTPLLPDKTLASLGKMALNFMTNIFCTKYFPSQKLRPICPINRH